MLSKSIPHLRPSRRLLRTAIQILKQGFPLSAYGPRGFDAGKKIKGRKRHIVTDTQGNLLSAIVHPANVQDRDGAPVTLASASYPTIAHLFADGGYAGEKLENALRKIDGPTIGIIKRPDDAKGFVIVARRWVVERTLAWLNRCRRLAKGLGGLHRAGPADWDSSLSGFSA
ncbi:transposase [Bradyrhizobium ottawaense]